MFKKVLYKIVHIVYSALSRLVLAIQNILSVTHNYQPDPFSGIKKHGARDSFDRYEAILKNTDFHSGSLIDLGCNRGFFVLKYASEDIFSVGVDHDWFEILYAKGLAENNNINKSIFMNEEINMNFIKNMPIFDMIICTSIFHHWVRIYSKETAFDMMRMIALKTNKYLIFETGQYDEIETSWYQNLEFMGSDSKRWVEDFLLDIGFDKVKDVGVFETNLSNVKRNMFIATKE